MEIGGFAKEESPVSLKAYSDTPEDCTVRGRGGGREINNNNIEREFYRIYLGTVLMHSKALYVTLPQCFPGQGTFTYIILILFFLVGWTVLSFCYQGTKEPFLRTCVQLPKGFQWWLAGTQVPLLFAQMKLRAFLLDLGSRE